MSLFGTLTEKLARALRESKQSSKNISAKLSK
jgi:hypothetical protein